jgi:hypothetical protein
LIVELLAYQFQVEATCVHQLVQFTCVVFHQLATSHTQHVFQVGVRLQNVSNHQLSVTNSKLTSLTTQQASTVKLSVFTVAGLFHHSIATDTSTLLVIIAAFGAAEST